MDRYFAGLLPPIDLGLEPSADLLGRPVRESSRTAAPTGSGRSFARRLRREIRLSLPLLQQVAQRSEYGKQEIMSTLAHEMIHQWQYDILKRRPNHGPNFLRKMTEMNRDGTLAITIYHSLQKEVLALTQFAWRCRQCGRVYRRQRRTIQPRRHHCGICRGLLQELVGSVSRIPTDSERASHTKAPPSQRPLQPLQLSFTF